MPEGPSTAGCTRKNVQWMIVDKSSPFSFQIISQLNALIADLRLVPVKGVDFLDAGVADENRTIVG